MEVLCEPKVGMGLKNKEDVELKFERTENGLQIKIISNGKESLILPIIIIEEGSPKKEISVKEKIKEIIKEDSSYLRKELTKELIKEAIKAVFKTIILNN
jgi:hypothetical protein